jgi:hypothetical protein
MSAFRRPTVVPSHSSYAAVLAGQAHHSSGSNNGFDNHISSSTYHPHTSAASQHVPRPATVPSYLAESAYAERLASKISTVFSPPPTGAIGLSSAKKPQSHRGLALDVVEHPPRGEEVNFLPSRWNESDKSPSLELLNGGTEVRFIGGPTRRSHLVRDRPVLTDATGPAKVSESDAAAVRADRPMPPECGLFYYEATIVSAGKEG